MSGNVTLTFEILEIVWINILLSGDNAILIALACRGLPKDRRRQGVLLGALFGVLLRVGFTLMIVELLDVPFLKIVGALMLIGVAVKLPNEKVDHSKVEAKPDLWGAVTAIVVADAVMSLDNVIAIAAAAHGSPHLIIFGIALSAPLVMFGADTLMKILDRLPILVFLGSGILGFEAGQLAATDPFLARFGALPARAGDLTGAAACVLVLTLGTLWKLATRHRPSGGSPFPEAGSSNQPQGPLSGGAAED